MLDDSRACESQVAANSGLMVDRIMWAQDHSHGEGTFG